MPSAKSRWTCVVSACLGTLPRRLIFVGAMTLLGWLGVALASAANASADPTGHSHATVTTSVDHLLAPLTTALAAHHPAAAHPATQPAHRTHQTHQHAARPATPRNTADTAQSQPLLGDVLPAVQRVVTRVTAPITTPLLGSTAQAKRAAATAPSTPPSTATPPAGQSLGQDLQTITRAVVATAEVTLRLPIVGLTIHIGIDPAVQPAPAAVTPVDTLVFTAPATHAADPLGAHVASNLPAVALTTTDGSRSADQPLPVTSSSTTASHATFLDGGPKPTPPAPPVLPGVATASASGSASSARSGSGAGIYSARISETWAAQHLHLLGTTEWARSRDVRNSATKPPVAPD